MTQRQRASAVGSQDTRVTSGQGRWATGSAAGPKHPFDPRPTKSPRQTCKKIVEGVVSRPPLVRYGGGHDRIERRQLKATTADQGTQTTTQQRPNRLQPRALLSALLPTDTLSRAKQRQVEKLVQNGL